MIGIPLRVTPKFEDNILDLGLVLCDKKPSPQIEICVENTGQTKYFMIPKLIYEEDFQVDSNRMEIHPGEILTIKVRICPKMSKNINNALCLNASSTGKDYQMFQTINFKGKFIKRNVYFSSNNVTIEIKHGNDYNQTGHGKKLLIFI